MSFGRGFEMGTLHVLTSDREADGIVHAMDCLGFHAEPLGAGMAFRSDDFLEREGVYWFVFSDKGMSKCAGQTGPVAGLPMRMTGEQVLAARCSDASAQDCVWEQEFQDLSAFLCFWASELRKILRGG